MLILETPTRMRLEGLGDPKRLIEALTFTNRAAAYEYRRFSKNHWFAEQHGEEAFKERLAELKAATKVCLVTEDDDGVFFTHPGLRQYIDTRFGTQEFQSLVKYPETRSLPWHTPPENKLREYQVDALERLLEARHAAVEIGTGLGKSYIIMMLLKRLGLRAVIMAPFANIARQLFDSFTEVFGTKYVGLYGDGRKDHKKLFTVALAQSLTKIQPDEDDDVWNHFSNADVFIADESHLCPADTLASVCLGLMANAPYRFFFSGTQLRNDGADLLLKGITGPIVYDMTVRDGVDQGFLAKPHFFMVRCASTLKFSSSDPMKMTRKHLLYNPQVAALAGDIANRAVSTLNHQVLILVDEVGQITQLMPHLKHEFAFAHAGTTTENKKKVPERFHKSNPKTLVEQFNEGKLPILVGTSCIATGTDIRPVGTLISIQGGKSHVKFAQGLGRGTRRPPGKTYFNYFDFAPRMPHVDEDYDLVFRHAMERSAIYSDIYGPVRWIGSLP